MRVSSQIRTVFFKVSQKRTDKLKSNVIVNKLQVNKGMGDMLGIFYIRPMTSRPAVFDQSNLYP